jgi:hypothetical protein
MYSNHDDDNMQERFSRVTKRVQPKKWRTLCTSKLSTFWYQIKNTPSLPYHAVPCVYCHSHWFLRINDLVSLRWRDWCPRQTRTQQNTGGRAMNITLPCWNRLLAPVMNNSFTATDALGCCWHPLSNKDVRCEWRIFLRPMSRCSNSTP